MTYLEKALEMDRQIGVTREEYEIIARLCPYHAGLEEKEKVNTIVCRTERGGCMACWNREMPYTELSDTEKTFSQGFEEGMSEGITQGQNDVWELAKKIALTTELIKTAKIFINKNICGIERKELFERVFELTPQEALAKLKAYEEAQNKAVVGDVIKDNYDDVAVILDETESYFKVLTKSGCVEEWKKDICQKTNKHIDIQSILEQIAE